MAEIIHLCSKVCLAILLTAAIAGCNRGTPTPDPKLVDQSFLTDRPCAPPCYYGLKVDQSTKKEVLDKIKSIPFIDVGSATTLNARWPYDNQAKQVYFDCLYGGQKYPGCISFVFSSGTLKRIEQTALFPLTIKIMVDKLGPPDYYIDFVQPGETIACSESFGWISKQIVASSYFKHECPNAKSPVSADTIIQTLDYSAKDDDLLMMCPACVPFPGLR